MTTSIVYLERLLTKPVGHTSAVCDFCERVYAPSPSLLRFCSAKCRKMWYGALISFVEDLKEYLVDERNKLILIIQDNIQEKEKLRRYIEKQYPNTFRKKRVRILTRDNFMCILCGKLDGGEFATGDASLHIHHVDSNIKNNEDWNLVSLCRSCHMSVTWRREPKSEFNKDVFGLLMKLASTSAISTTV